MQAWRSQLSKDIEMLEKVQRRATRMVEGCRGRRYEDRLKILRMTTLETRRERADNMQEVYKIIKGIEEIEFKDFFDMSKDTLRGHKFKLFKKRFNLNVGKFNFGNRVINS